MKNISRIILLSALPLLAGCPPREQVTGRVLSLTGPVPQAAVLGMIWMEDADKIKPAPVIDGLSAQERDAAYDKDVTERGLPVAYARAFTDENGWFTLDKFQFSSETKKAVKAMKHPKITRVTLCAFQRGYLKQALTAFPKDETELPYAVLMLFKPRNWKDMAGDSSFSSLERPEFYNGYSKEFGATAKEKAWFFEYTHSNLYQAYEESDIKGEKEWEAYCGHDYSDVIMSTSGMQRNPEREKCGELLKRISAIRKNEKIWADHWLYTGEWAQTARILVSEALAGLDAETGEPREYAREILEGVNTAGDRLGAARTVDLPEDSRLKLEEAKLSYGRGNKTAAYAALGQALYARIRAVPEDVQITKIITASQDALAGFYKLMNRPLTAQLPGSDKAAGTKEEKKLEPKPTKIKLGDDEVDIDAIRTSLGVEISQKQLSEPFGDHEALHTITKKAFHTPNSGYFIKIENHFVEAGDQIDDERAKLELYTAGGTKILDKELAGGEIQYVHILKNGTFLIEREMNLPDYYRAWGIYDSHGEMLYESRSVNYFTVSPQADYSLFLEKTSTGVNLIKMDLQGHLKTLAVLHGDILGIQRVSNDGRTFLILDGKEIEKIAPSGEKYRKMDLKCFQGDKLVWTESIEAEGDAGSTLSRNGKYLVARYNTDYKVKEEKVDRETYKSITGWTQYFRIVNLTTKKVIKTGLQNDELINKYINETIDEEVGR